MVVEELHQPGICCCCCAEPLQDNAIQPVVERQATCNPRSGEEPGRKRSKCGISVTETGPGVACRLEGEAEVDTKNPPLVFGLQALPNIFWEEQPAQRAEDKVS